MHYIACGRGTRQIKHLSTRSSRIGMIGTMGFESDKLISVTDNIDKFMEDMTKQHGSTFRLIDIKFSSASKLLQDARQNSDVNYSALVIYEV
jgi:hypothetical protein